MVEPVAWIDEGGLTLAPGGVLLSSFPSAGLAATVAAHYIVQTLGLPRIGLVQAPDSAALALVQGGRVQPAVRVHGRRDFAIVLSELPVSPSAGPDLARMILDGAERRGARLVVGFEGVYPHPGAETPDQPEGPEEEVVWGILSRPDDAISATLSAAKARPLSDGIIGGVSGALLVEGIRRKVPVVVLLVSARPSEQGLPDHRAGAALIETLDRMLPEFQIDTGPLRTRAQLIEKALRNALKSRPTRRPDAGVLGPGAPEPTIYG